jgi:hypothetical protein
MPLNPEDKVRRSAFRGLAALYRLNNGILWAASGDTEAIPGDADRLMVARVDGKAEEKVLLWSLGCGDKSAEEGVWGNRGGVSDGDTAASGMVYGEESQVLDQRAATPDIEELDSEADGEDWLIEVVGVLDEKLIHIFAKAISGGALGDRFLPVLVRVHVGRATGQQHSLAGVDKVGDGRRSGNEWDFNRLAATALDG